MYGLVNKAVVDLVVSKFGQDTWNAIKKSCVNTEPNAKPTRRPTPPTTDRGTAGCYNSCVFAFDGALLADALKRVTAQHPARWTPRRSARTASSLSARPSPTATR